MADRSSIEWTDATVNFWWGCTKVSAGCDHCYAETFDRRLGGRHWGPGAPRKEIAGAHDLMRRLDRRSARHIAAGNVPLKVFVQSMSDIFDNEAPRHWRAQAFETMERCPNLRIQLLTKRVGNVLKMVPEHWLISWPKHVGLMITVVDQLEADRDVPKLLELRAKLSIPWVGLSIEPLLGQIDLQSSKGGTLWIGGQRGCCGLHHHPGQSPHNHGPGTSVHFGDPRKPHHHHDERCRPGLDWVICGGESGPGARPMHPDWARSLRDQCAAAGAPFFFKQWGEWLPFDYPDDESWYAKYHMSLPLKFWDGAAWRLTGSDPDETTVWVARIGKKEAGRLIDNTEHHAFPPELLS